MVENYGLIPL